ncbi:MAG: hypothetical protein OCD02_11790 [Spirochaetaceae bacterium]
MKKQLLLIYLVLATSLAFCLNVDYGVSIDSFVGTDSEDPFGFEKVSIYSSLQITEKVSFAIDGFYKFGYSSEDPTHTFDFATLVAIFPIGSINFQVGRAYMGDYSGDILAHTLDGLTATMAMGSGSLSINAGYSGLIHEDEISIISTIEDDDEETVKRLIEGADYIIPLGSLTGWVSVYTFQDFNSLSTNLSVFFGGGLKGSIGSDLYYSLRGNFQGGLYPYLDSETLDTESETLIAGMGVLSLDWYLQFEKIKFLTPAISLNIGISSGDDTISDGAGLGDVQPDLDDLVSLYSPITTGGPGTIYSTNNQNLMYMKVGASVSPLDTLQTQLSSVVYFRTVEGATSDSNVDSEESGNYLGTEISLAINYRPFSDLGVSVSGGFFFPDGTVIDDDPSGMITAYVSLSL